ncbi:hypothetical protein ACS127_08285 [Amphibacillus sp. Q70]|uniref:hypothetical protein n=1 Tax=Amphibacillus sp. Q70 TaxID=3453416 RepID=UPI003F84F46D
MLEMGGLWHIERTFAQGVMVKSTCLLTTYDQTIVANDYQLVIRQNSFLNI